MRSDQIVRVTATTAGMIGLVTLAVQACHLSAKQAAPPTVEVETSAGQPTAPLEAWVSPELEPGELERALAHSKDRMRFVLEDYERWVDFANWALGYARPQAPGPALARCYLEYAPRIEGACAWTQQLVVRRNAPDAGEVVYVEMIDDQQTDACKQMLACVGVAWRGVVAPLPSGDEDYIAVSFGGTPCVLGEGLGEGELRHALEQRKTNAEQSLKSMRECTEQACAHNRQIDQACLVHIAELERALSGGT